jgi:hypothetical protein
VRATFRESGHKELPWDPSRKKIDRNPLQKRDLGRCSGK